MSMGRVMDGCSAIRLESLSFTHFDLNYLLEKKNEKKTTS